VGSGPRDLGNSGALPIWQIANFLVVDWVYADEEGDEVADIERRREIGQNIRAAREHAGLTLQELAARVESDAPRLSRMENGERGLDSVLLFDIADALEVSVDSLLVSGRILAFARGDRQPGQEDPHVRWGVRMIEEMQAAERLVKRYGL
jgi:transcriptional regulator with XRE-family HTH domain